MCHWREEWNFQKWAQGQAKGETKHMNRLRVWRWPKVIATVPGASCFTQDPKRSTKCWRSTASVPDTKKEVQKNPDSKCYDNENCTISKKTKEELCQTSLHEASRNMILRAGAATGIPQHRGTEGPECLKEHACPHDAHCIFVETSPNSNNWIFPWLRMVFLHSLLSILKSPVHFKSVMKDSVGTVFWAYAPSLESWSFFLDLEVLHSVVLLAHAGRFCSGLLQHTIARCLIVAALLCRAALSDVFVASESFGT